MIDPAILVPGENYRVRTKSSNTNSHEMEGVGQFCGATIDSNELMFLFSIEPHAVPLHLISKIWKTTAEISAVEKVLKEELIYDASQKEEDATELASRLADELVEAVADHLGGANAYEAWTAYEAALVRISRAADVAQQYMDNPR